MHHCSTEKGIKDNLTPATLVDIAISYFYFSSF
jgi:hypothetical protein